MENSVAGSQEASGQSQLSLNPPCVPNLPLKTFKFQADKRNLSPYKANPLLLNIGEEFIALLVAVIFSIFEEGYWLPFTSSPPAPAAAKAEVGFQGRMSCGAPSYSQRAPAGSSEGSGTALGTGCPGQGGRTNQAVPDLGLMMERDVKRQEEGEPWLIDFDL